MEKSPVYVETHIVMAEYLLSNLTSSTLSSSFFRRRANSYRTVTALVSNPDAKLDDQIFAMICLHLVEHAIGRYDLQSIHLRAMHNLVEECGGLRSFYESRQRGHSLLEPSFYSGQFMYVELKLHRDSLAARRAVEATFSYLRQIQAWTSLRFTSAAVRANNKVALRRIHEYLLNGINQYLQEPTTPYHHAAGAFYVLFNIHATMSEFNMDAETVTEFLLLLQLHLVKSVGSQDQQVIKGQRYDAGDLRGLHPGVVTFLIPQIVRKIQGGRHDEDRAWGMLDTTQDDLSIEISIAEATVNAMKTFSLLSTSARLVISRELFRACMVTVESTLGETFTDEALEDLRPKHEGKRRREAVERARV
jgi:hypothetical protein